MKIRWLEENTGRLIHVLIIMALLFLGLYVTLPLIHYLVRMFLDTPINYNEGWNAFHTLELLQGQPIYGNLNSLPLTPVNYPPLSFLLTAVLSLIFRDVLLTGRILAFIGYIGIAVIIFKILRHEKVDKKAALVCAGYFLALIIFILPNYIGMNDPQFLGHLFSVSALFLYISRKYSLNLSRILVIAFLICVSIFIKHSLVVVPFVVAIDLFVRDRKRFLLYAVSGIFFSMVFIALWWMYAGEGVLRAFQEDARVFSLAAVVSKSRRVLLKQLILGITLLVTAGFCFRRGDRLLYFMYLASSLALGTFAAGGMGVNLNVYFDFFIALSLGTGIVFHTAVTSGKLNGTGKSIAVFLLVLFSCGALLKNIAQYYPRQIKSKRIRKRDATYQKDVAYLASFSGDALFEMPLLGYHAGKQFLYDPFMASQLIHSGKVPWKVIEDPIRKKQFTVIAMQSDIEKELHKSPHRVFIRGPWPRRILEEINRSYKPVELPRRSLFHFYVPRK